MLHIPVQLGIRNTSDMRGILPYMVNFGPDVREQMAPYYPVVKRENVLFWLLLDDNLTAVNPILDRGPNRIAVAVTGNPSIGVVKDSLGNAGKALTMSGTYSSNFVGSAASASLSPAKFTLNMIVSYSNAAEASDIMATLEGYIDGFSIRKNFAANSITIFHNGTQLDTAYTFVTDKKIEVELGFDGTTAYLFIDGVLKTTYTGQTIVATPRLFLGFDNQGGSTSTTAKTFYEVIFLNYCLHTKNYIPRMTRFSSN